MGAAASKRPRLPQSPPAERAETASPKQAAPDGSGRPRATMAYLEKRNPVDSNGVSLKDADNYAPIGDWIRDDLLGTHCGDRRCVHEAVVRARGFWACAAQFDSCSRRWIEGIARFK